jgi:isoleucyl-tRNA synthetase
MTENPLGDFKVGDMSTENYGKIDLHRHIMDTVVLTSPSGKAMHRESDLIDVWFDSGSCLMLNGTTLLKTRRKLKTTAPTPHTSLQKE